MRKREDDHRLPELWRRYKSDHDQSARDELIERYRHLAALTSNRYWHRLSPYMEREDVEEEATLALLKALDTFDPEYGTQFATWAIACLTRYLMGLIKFHENRRRIAPQVSLDTWEGPLLEAFLTDSADPEAEALTRCEIQAVEEYLEELKELDRLVLECRYFGDLTHADTGEALGLTERQARHREARALKALQKRLKGEG